MSLISRMRKQLAVYWSSQKFDDFGQPIPLEPVEIKCRWEDVQVEYLTKDGTKQVSNSVVYVDRDVELDGFLWLGELSELTSQTVPEQNEGAHRIKQVNKIPNLKAKEFLITAIL